MQTLILVRHSVVKQQRDESSHTWELTAEGRTRCITLAQQIQIYQPQVIVTSAEPKAIQTGQVVAQQLHLPVETEPDLGEHRRATAPYFDSEAEFKAHIRKLLTQPDKLVFGEETGTQACTRFCSAIETILKRHVGKNIAAVTHGTVMALFVAQVTGIDPVSFWESLAMPAYVVLELPQYRIIKTVSSIIT